MSISATGNEQNTVKYYKVKVSTFFLPVQKQLNLSKKSFFLFQEKSNFFSTKTER